MKTVYFITLIVLISLLQFSHATKYQLAETCCPGCSYYSSCCCAPIHTSIKHVTMTGIPPSIPPMPPGKIPRQLLPNHLCPICPSNVKLSSTGTKYCCKPKRHVTITSTIWIAPTTTSKTITPTPTPSPRLDCNLKLSGKTDLTYTLNDSRGFSLRATVDLKNSSLTWTNCSWKTTLNRTPKFITFSLVSLKRSNLDFTLTSLTFTNPSTQPMTLFLNNLTIPLPPNSSQSISPNIPPLQSFTIKRQDPGKLYISISNIQVSLVKYTTSTIKKTTFIKSSSSTTTKTSTISIQFSSPSQSTSQSTSTSSSTSTSTSTSTSSTSQSTSTSTTNIAVVPVIPVSTTSTSTTCTTISSSSTTKSSTSTTTSSSTTSSSTTSSTTTISPIPKIPRFDQFIAYNVTPLDLAQDSLGNVYTVGWFMGTVNFDSFSFTGPNVDFDPFYGYIGATTGYIAKISNNGTYDWVKTFTGPLGINQLNYYVAAVLRITPDENFSVAVYAGTSFTIDNLSIPADSSIVKFSPDGIALSVFSLGGFSLNDIIYDNDGNFYFIASSTGNSLNLHGINATGLSLLVAKISSNLTAIWYKNIPGQFEKSSILLDNDVIYIGSSYNGPSGSFNFNGVNLTSTPNRLTNLFAAWSSINGSNIWAKSTPSVDTYNSIPVTRGDTTFVNFYLDGGNLIILCYYRLATLKVNDTFTLYTGNPNSIWLRGVKLTVTLDGNIIDAWQANNSWFSAINVGSEIYAVGPVYNSNDLHIYTGTLCRYASNGTQLSTTYAYQSSETVSNFGNNIFLTGSSEYGVNRNNVTFYFGPWNSTLSSQNFVARLKIGQI